MPSPFAQAIAIAEGYGVAGAIPTVNNNPGDLRGWPGVPTDAQGYSVFPTAAAGWAALEQQLSTIGSGESNYYTPDMTIAQMGSTWADGDPNWAANVSGALGVTSSAMIGQLIGSSPSAGAPGVMPSPDVDVEPETVLGMNPQTLLYLGAGALALFFISEILA
jgi:hypothetical protein